MGTIVIIVNVPVLLSVMVAPQHLSFVALKVLDC
jgi:hypothetical protein